MAISSAQKETRRSVRKAARNKRIVSSLKTSIGKATGAIVSGKMEEGAQGALGAVRALDKAAQKGIIHPKNAARRKSRIMKRLHKAQATSKA